MAAQVNLKSVGDFGYGINRYGILRVDNILVSLDSRIDEYFNQIDGREKCDDPGSSKLHGQRWTLSSANLKLSPFFNRCKFGSLHDVTIKLESKQPSLSYFTCKIWSLDRPSEEICTAKIVKTLSSVNNLVLAKQGHDGYHHSWLRKYFCSINIRPSDLDVNGSIKFNNLLVYCQHAASRAMNDKKLENISDLTSLLEIQQVQIDLINRASQGNVKIHVWQDKEADNYNLKFLITQGVNNICKVSIKLDCRNKARIVPYDHLPIIYYEDNCRIIPTSHCCSYRDRFNNPHLIHFIRITGRINNAMLFYEDIASLKQLSKGARNLIVRQHLHLSKEFFALRHDAALQHEIRIASIGSSSIITNQNIHHHSDCVVRVFAKIVLSVDGKIKEIPSWYRRRYENLYNKIKYRKMNFPIEIPKKVYKYRFESRFDDIDGNFHTNQSIYICNCLNAASDVVTNKSLAYHTHFGNDFNLSCITDIHSNYYAESFEFEILDVLTWQDCNNNTLQFLIKHDERTLFYMTATIRDEIIVGSKL